MKHTSTTQTRTTAPRKMCLVLCLSIFLLMFSKIASAHKVEYYNPPCFTQGSTVTMQVWIIDVYGPNWFHWQYRPAGGNWIYLSNGNNTINGRVFSVANASFASVVEYNSTGALLTPALTISNVGTPTNPTATYTTQLDNIELRVLMTEGPDPQTNPGADIYGGEEYLAAYEAKYVRLISKPATESCYTNCTDNRVVVNPASPTLDTYYGGFEMQPFSSANFFTPNGSTGATNANTDLVLWTSGSPADKYRMLNNPDSMDPVFSAFTPHSGRAMLVVHGNNSCTDRVWYRTITVPNINQFFQGTMTFKAWFAKVGAGVNPNIVLEVRGATTTTSNTYISISTVTQTISGAVGAWVQLSMAISVPLHAYKKLEFSIKTSNGCSNAVSVAVDDICLLEPVSGVLPVVLTPLKGYYSKGVSHLTWSSLQESNSSHFEIERSTDGIAYTYLAKVNAKGSSDKVVEYLFNDITVNSTNNYYRLKLFDKDGKFQYSNILLLTVRTEGTYITGIYPSPFVDKINVNVTSEIKDDAIVLLYDNTGRQLASQQATIKKGVNTITLDNLAGLANGIYLVKVQVGNDIVLTKKLVK